MRAVGLVFFFAVLAGVVYLIVGGGGPTDVSAEDRDLAVAEEAGDVLGDLENLAEKAMDNAERAEELAKQLTLAASRARQSAGDLDSITVQNEAAAMSGEAALLAADDAEKTALMMRRYADRMKGRIARTLAAAEEAEAIADMAIEVEQTQAAAAAAAAKAKKARARMAETEQSAARIDAPLNADLQDGIDAGATDPDLTEPQGEIVIINDNRPQSPRTRDTENVQQRLDTIFPDDIIDYEEEDDIPYGERG